MNTQTPIDTLAAPAAAGLLQSDRTLRKPLAIDLYAGLGGWAEGLLAEGYDVVGFDNHRHAYMMPGSNKQKRSRIAKYPAQLVLQDVLTLHGSQFRDAAVIVASPPCQNYSYLAMPWSNSPDEVRPCGDGWEVLNSRAAKELREKWEREGPDNRLFDACFRIQQEAIQARMLRCVNCIRSGEPCSDCYIPLIVENVRGAQPWVGRSAWNYGSFHLWGDVPALMPINLKREQKVPGFRFDGSGGSFQSASVEATGQKQNPDGTNHPTGSWFRIADSSQGDRGKKIPAYSDPRRNGGKGVHLTSPAENEAGTIGGDWFSDPQSTCRKHGSRSNARKAASAKIAKIPFELARHIAAVYYPRSLAQGARLRDAAGKS